MLKQLRHHQLLVPVCMAVTFWLSFGNWTWTPLVTLWLTRKTPPAKPEDFDPLV